MSTPTSARWRWLAFAAALAATLMDLMDSTIANVAAPAIRADLGGSYADLQWIAAGVHPGHGRDAAHRRAGSATCSGANASCSPARPVSPWPRSRVPPPRRSRRSSPAARCRERSGPSWCPQVFGLIRDLFRPEEMGKAFGILGPACGLSAILGPVVAGLLIDADLFGTGWRTIFLVNVPVGAFVLVAGTRYLPDVAPSAPSRRLDVVSVALAALGAFMLVYPLVQGRELGWPPWTQLLMVGALPVLGRLRLPPGCARRRPGAAPLVEPSIFAKRSYVSRDRVRAGVPWRDGRDRPHARRPAAGRSRATPRSMQH